MPRKQDLPEPLQRLEAHNALSFSAERWHDDIDKLVELLRPHAAKARTWKFTNLRRLEGHSSGVCCLAFSPDGTKLASSGTGGKVFAGDCSVRLWRVDDGALLAVMEGHTKRVISLAFSSDGNMLASGSKDETAGLWSVADGTLLHSLEAHEQYLYEMAFLADDATLLGAGQHDPTLLAAAHDAAIRLWRISDGKLLRTIDVEDLGDADFAVSPDRSILITWCDNKAVRAWQAADGKLLHKLKEKGSRVFQADVSPDGQSVASVWDDAVVRLWSLQDQALVHRFEGNGDLALAVAFSPNGEILAVASDDQNVRLWRIQDESLVHTLPNRGATGEIDALTFSPDGAALVVSGNGVARLWSVADGRQLRMLDDDLYWQDLKFSPDGQLLAAPVGESVQV